PRFGSVRIRRDTIDPSGTVHERTLPSQQDAAADQSRCSRSGASFPSWSVSATPAIRSDLGQSASAARHGKATAPLPMPPASAALGPERSGFLRGVCVKRFFRVALALPALASATCMQLLYGH